MGKDSPSGPRPNPTSWGAVGGAGAMLLHANPHCRPLSLSLLSPLFYFCFRTNRGDSASPARKLTGRRPRSPPARHHCSPPACPHHRRAGQDVGPGRRDDARPPSSDRVGGRASTGTNALRREEPRARRSRRRAGLLPPRALAATRARLRRTEQPMEEFDLARAGRAAHGGARPCARMVATDQGIVRGHDRRAQGWVARRGGHLMCRRAPPA